MNPAEIAQMLNMGDTSACADELSKGPNRLQLIALLDELWKRRDEARAPVSTIPLEMRLLIIAGGYAPERVTITPEDAKRILAAQDAVRSLRYAAVLTCGELPGFPTGSK